VAVVDSAYNLESSVFFPFFKQSSDDEECSAKGRNRHIVVNKAELTNSIEVLESFKLARESWELLYSLEFLDKGKSVPVVLCSLTFCIKSLCHWQCLLFC
jgi:hypothetical protein